MEIWRTGLLCGVALLLICPTLGAECTVPATEVQALRDLYEGTSGRWAWKNKAHWEGGGSPCSKDKPWDGVVCTPCPSSGGEQHIMILNMEWNELDGNITASLGDLSHLQVLNLATNNLQGSLPPSLGKLKKLRALRLSYNRFSGKYPPELLQLSNLELLEVPYNDLVGNVNDLLNAYPKLLKISLRGNRGFSGDLYAARHALKKMKNLRVLDFHMNFVGGILPKSLFRLKHLEEVVLSKNVVSGPLPRKMRAPKLRVLTLTANFINGTIPASVAKLPSLTHLDLHRNYVSGSLPSAFASLKNIQEVKLSDNVMDGPIPDFLYSMTSLETLDWSNSDLYGTISDAISNLKNLKTLRLHSCRLTGTIPVSIGELKNLTELVLFNNKLSGEIPSSVGQLTHMIHLSLRHNLLSGAIPESLGNLHVMQRLELDHNQLTSLPDSVGDLAALVYLMANDNQLQGTVPSVIGYLHELRTLALHNNRLTGDRIPTSFSNLLELEDFTLHNNLLPGNPWPHIDSSHSNPYNRYPSCDDMSNHTTGKPFRKYFRICGTRNDFFVDIFLQEKAHQWRETHGGNWHAVYGKCKYNSVFAHHYDFQTAAQYMDMFEIADKSKFAAHNRQLREFFNGKYYDFHPPTFRMPFEYDLWKEEHEKHPGGYWLLKPIASCCGQNIKLITGPEEMPGDLGNWVIQRFVHNAHMIHGHKYVLRLFAIVTSFDPLRVYMFPDGDVFYTHANYTLDKEKTDKSRGYFITDYFFTMKQREFYSTSTHLMQYFRSQGIDTDKMWKDLQDVVVKSLLTGEVRLRHQEHEYDSQKGTIYEVLGYDILYDDNLKPWVCEVNTAPNLGLEINKPNDPVIHEEDFDLKTRLMRQTLEITGTIPLKPTNPNQAASTDDACRGVVDRKLLELGLRVNESVYCMGLQDFQCITADEIELLKQFECEYERRGEFELMFPNHDAPEYLPAWPIPRRANYLSAWWHQLRRKPRPAGQPGPWSTPVRRVWRELNRSEAEWAKHKMTEHQPCEKWNTEENGEPPDPSSDAALALDDDAQFPVDEFPEDAKYQIGGSDDDYEAAGSPDAEVDDDMKGYEQFTQEEWASFFAKHPEYAAEAGFNAQGDLAGSTATKSPPSATGATDDASQDSQGYEAFEESYKQK